MAGEFGNMKATWILQHLQLQLWHTATEHHAAPGDQGKTQFCTALVLAVTLEARQLSKGLRGKACIGV